MNIYNNKQINLAAKTATITNINDENIINYSNKINISLTFLRKLVKNSLLNS